MNGRQTGARVGAGSHEVQITITGVPVMRPEIAHLQQIMAEAMNGTLDQVEPG
jgi:hypothetical protein